MGASVAMADLDGDGLPNDLVNVDPRTDLVTVALTLLGAFGVGLVSTLANGCPFRQHVLAAQGVVSSMTYVAGFLAGAVAFHAFVAPMLLRFLP